MPGLSVPAIKVNNNVVAIVPNSFKYTAGDGEIKVRAASSGGGNVVAVHTEDAESKFSTVKFSLHILTNTLDLVRDWKADIGGIMVEVLQRGRGTEPDFSFAFPHMSVTNDPEINAAADGVIEIEMAGDKLEQ